MGSHNDSNGTPLDPLLFGWTIPLINVDIVLHLKNVGRGRMHVHCKKRLATFPSPAGMSLTILSLGGSVIKFFPPRESLVSNIPAGDGNFFTVYV
jgi:hypothetical protein